MKSRFEQAKGWTLTFRRRPDGQWAILTGEFLICEGGTWSLSFGEGLFEVLVCGRALREEVVNGVKFLRTGV